MIDIGDFGKAGFFLGLTRGEAGGGVLRECDWEADIGIVTLKLLQCVGNAMIPGTAVWD